MPAFVGAPSDRQVEVYSCRLDNKIHADQGSTLTRRVGGPEADELFLVCRPQCPGGDIAAQAESVYTEMLERLAREGACVAAVATETLFVRHIREDLEVILDARQRVMAQAEGEACRVVPTAIEQAPLNQVADLELAVVAVVTRSRPHRPAYDVCSTPTCRCGECSPAPARIVHVGDHKQLYAGNIYGAGQSAFDEAYAMFCSAEGLLHEAGMSFGDVIRTWIYLRDMDRDYAEFNRARREFFRGRDIELKPASTAVGGGAFPESHDFSLRLYAVSSPRPVRIEVMSAPTLNEAWMYGSDFSRGLKVEEANKVALYVSGTASIDEAGRTVHVGDVEAQARRMLTNISSLLVAYGASFEDLVSAVTYVKNASDAEVVAAMFKEHGFEGFPCTFVEAAVCRPELLCETEAVAVVPLPEPRG